MTIAAATATIGTIGRDRRPLAPAAASLVQVLATNAIAEDTPATSPDNP